MIKVSFILLIVLIFFSCKSNSTADNKKVKKPSKEIKRPTHKITSEEKKISNKNVASTIEDSIGEYSSYEIEFEFETKAGVFKGYTNIPTFYLDRDSIKSLKHLKKAFTWLSIPKYMNYARNRFFVPVTECYDNKLNLESEDSKYKLSYHVDFDSVPMSQVKNITIKTIFVDSQLFGIANKLTLVDTTWINTTQPIRCVNINGYLCQYTLMIYEESTIINEVIKKSKHIIAKYNKDERTPSEIEEGFLKESASDKGSVLDEKLSELINKLNGLKIVIVAFCTC